MLAAAIRNGAVGVALGLAFIGETTATSCDWKGRRSMAPAPFSFTQSRGRRLGLLRQQ